MDPRIAKLGRGSFARLVGAGALLLALALTNIAQFYDIEQTRDPEMDAVRLLDADDRDLISVGLEGSYNVSRWFSSHATIGEHAPNAEVLLPAGAPFSNARIRSSLFGFGKATGVSFVVFSEQYSGLPEVLNDRGLQILEASNPATVFDGPGRVHFTSWGLTLSDDSEPATMLVGFNFSSEDGARLELVDHRLLRTSVGWEYVD